MKHRGHYYRTVILGRSIATVAGQGAMSFAARLSCSRCPEVGTVNLRVIMPPEQIDKKFQQAGWSLDPHVCPNCIAQANKERKTMSAKPSPDAMRAQAQMFNLLQSHFDADKGAFSNDWHDQRIATDTGLSVAVVREYRETCFGPLKEPAELQGIRNDLASIEKLQQESASAIAAEIAAMRARVNAVAMQWAKA